MANNMKHNPLQLDTTGGTSHYPSGGRIKSIFFGGNADVDTTVLLYNAKNLVHNPNFSLWSNGTSSDPDGWVLAGTAATVARESTVIRSPVNEMSDPGLYSALVTRVGNDLTFSQNVLTNFDPNDPRSDIDWWKGRTIMGGMWLNCTTTAQAKVETYDGQTTTASSDHGGSDAWTWLATAAATVHASATELTIRAVLDTGNDGLYCSGALLFECNPIYQLLSTGNAQGMQYPSPGLDFDGLYLATLTGGVLQVQI
jgi:hypothetical protein